MAPLRASILPFVRGTLLLGMARIFIGWVWIAGFASVLETAHLLAETPELRVEMGLGGSWKVGFPVRMVIHSSTKLQRSDLVEVHTTDGDGVPVVYRSEVKTEGSIHEMIVQHGRSKQPIRIRIIGKSGTTDLNHLLSDEERGEALPATQPWLVSINGDLSLEKSAFRTIDGSLPSFSATHVLETKDLPTFEEGYAGVDQLLVSTLHGEGLTKITPDQQVALRSWVAHGGRILISVGNNAKLVASLAWLQELLPSRILDRVDRIDPGPLESWVNSEKPLDPISCARMEKCSLVDLNALTNRREPFPLISRRAFGFGQVLVVATDLDSNTLMSWGDRTHFLDKLLLGTWKKNKEKRNSGVGSALGYEDLSGQLRATLDVFPRVTTANLTLLSAILILFLSLVAPFDYFVVSKVWNRPKWTWWTLLASAILTCCGVGYLAQQWKPASLSLNELAVWDFDSDLKMIYGRSWMHLYSGRRDRLQIDSVPPTDKDATGITRSMKTFPSVWIDWQGLPGSGLGGFESAVASDRGMPEYQIATSFLDEGASEKKSHLERLGIPFAGTKSLHARWSMPWSDLPNNVRLRLIKGSDLLEGSWTNPLAVDIHDGSILYRNWQYPLPTRFQPGQSIEFSLSTQPRDLARRLQRRRIIDGSERSLPWDPFERNDLGRLAEILFFYKAAGGEGYTLLGNNYLRGLDYSELLRMDRAIVVGQVKEGSLQMRAATEGGEPTKLGGNRQTWIRILVPVVSQ